MTRLVAARTIVIAALPHLVLPKKPRRRIVRRYLSALSGHTQYRLWDTRGYDGSLIIHIGGDADR